MAAYNVSSGPKDIFPGLSDHCWLNCEELKLSKHALWRSVYQGAIYFTDSYSQNMGAYSFAATDGSTEFTVYVWGTRCNCTGKTMGDILLAACRL